ncbi:MAG: hypothetical protein JJ958_09165, partial [Balneola sp.]|nr:hypothetical protein [Balneola sp.]
GLSLLNTLLAALGIAVLVLLISYFFNYKLQYNRLNKLEEISRNISKKRFAEYQDITTNYSDEIDYLVKHFVKSSRTIEREIQRLNRIENYRKEFIGDISHELKTPIFAIQGFVETLLNGALEDENVNREFLKKTMRNVNRLIYLTKDLMEISKLETGELKSDMEPFYLYEVIHDVIDSLHHKAEKDDVALILNDFDKNIQVKADKNQIKQVLINLIENGVKYNVKGGKVEIDLVNFKKDKNRVLLVVKDTGIGIDEADLPRVTERFFRVDKSRSRERGGTGLGLAIVKHIIEAHREQLYFESKVNEGTTFKFTLRKVH